MTRYLPSSSTCPGTLNITQLRRLFTSSNARNCRRSRPISNSLNLHQNMEDISEERSRKRQRLSSDDEPQNKQMQLPHSLTSTISPPPLRRKPKPDIHEVKVIKSPFQLTWIRDLPESSNRDAVSLKDILGDPMISECWEFNYLHNLDFLMDAFDPDVRDLVKVHVVHGFWKNEDPGRLNLKVPMFTCIPTL